MLSLDQKYEHILSQERRWAKRVSRAVLTPRPIGVWEVLIPVLLVFNHVRWKGAREVFEKNLLFTKELALDAAMALAKGDRKRDEVLTGIREKTSSLLASDSQGVYSETIRNRQLEEIELLIDHYRSLLRTEGNDYTSLLTRAYGGLDRYRAFLEKLRAAEKAVNFAAIETLGTRADRKMLSDIERFSHQAREAVAREIFRDAW
ncbi:MAG: NF038143 family protein [Deltaproteobacteria bacterium]|nr:NF038143 family protein [Deltaproteobacteria bacterium]MBW2136270.1 NF038143 family protein [Deltaproteobacteria bacterium]